MDPVLEQILLDLLTRIGTEFKTHKGMIGTLSSLTTTEKSNLVAALNEVRASIAGAAGISDSTSTSSSTWSSQKITNYVIGVRDGILGGASAAYDTLLEIQQALQSDDTDISNILTALGNRVRTDADQGLNSTQQAQARSNINAVSADSIGDLSTDFVAAFEAALV